MSLTSQNCAANTFGRRPVKKDWLRKEWIGRSLLAAWAILAIAGMAWMSRKHWAALPVPANQTKLSRSLLRLRRHPNLSFLVDVIDSECSCSRSLLKHLVTRTPFPETEELILFAGHNPDVQHAATSAGFEYAEVSQAELYSGFSLESAPVLAFFDHQGSLLYAGGYYDHPAAVSPVDEKIHARLVAAQPFSSLPVFGCAVSGQLKKSLDPLWRFRSE